MVKENQNHSKVITFYSYKGGTGRTMALANMACFIASLPSKKKVLMIDWDLEAPGLHRYFQINSNNDHQKIGRDVDSIDSMKGLIELFTGFQNILNNPDIPKEKDQQEAIKTLLKPEKLQDYLTKTELASLHLLRAGDLSEDYPKRVRNFQWETLYEKAPWLIKLFIDCISEQYEFILVDSRTGFTDITGICTMILPEILIVVFTPNRQSLTGIIRLTKKAAEYRKQSDDLRPLMIFPLVSRVDSTHEKLRSLWRLGDKELRINGFQKQFEGLFREIYQLDECNLQEYFDEIQIQHDSWYAYGEKIAVLEGDVEERFSLAHSYAKLSKFLIENPAPWISRDIVKPDIDDKELREAYLNRLFNITSTFSLTGIDPKVANSTTVSLHIDSVYVPLNVSILEVGNRPLNYLSSGKGTRTLSTLDVLNRNSYLVLLGEPGSGKSTFINVVTLYLAGELLKYEEANIKLLSTYFSNKTHDQEEKKLSWNHGALIPIRIILRDFAARGLPETSIKATSSHLWDFIEADLKYDSLEAYAPYLKKSIIEEGALLLLDGLDEVPETDSLRNQVKNVIEDFKYAYPKCRILVTSRTYAYQKQNWCLNGFKVAIIAPFNDQQIKKFVDNWYKYFGESLNWPEDKCQSQSAALINALVKIPTLRALAERPLLLTLINILHAWRGGYLPQRREELYAEIVDLLLERWENPKIVRNSKGNIDILQPSLAEWLKVDKQKIRAFLNKLAFDGHLKQSTQISTADIPEDELVIELMELSANPDVKPKRLLEYLSHRAGLLLPRSEGVYTFPHLTIQEYLAACYLTDEDFPDKVANLARNDPSRWRETALLAGAKAFRGSASTIWALVDALCYKDVQTASDSHDDLWGAQIAAQALVEIADLNYISERHQSKISRVKQWQLRMIMNETFPPAERAAAGVNLGSLGDPRPEVVTTKGIEFCYVPEGSFWTGRRDKSASKAKFRAQNLSFFKENINHPYWISRFPISNAQYSEFIKDGGYEKEEFWIEAKQAKIWEKGKLKNEENGVIRNGIHDYGFPFNLPNHPAVGISWFEALAFTRWLTKRWRKTESIDKFMAVRLPNELEWEKAARGGIEIPSVPYIRQFETLIAIKQIEKQPNPLPKRFFPWGSEIDGNLVNYYETSIGRSSALGCFPGGTSPYGCEDICGNVWEWCYKKLYSKKNPKNKRLSNRYTGVFRGGAYSELPVKVGCSARIHQSAQRYFNNVGFRILISRLS